MQDFQQMQSLKFIDRKRILLEKTHVLPFQAHTNNTFNWIAKRALNKIGKEKKGGLVNHTSFSKKRASSDYSTNSNNLYGRNKKSLNKMNKTIFSPSKTSSPSSTLTILNNLQVRR